MIIEHSADTNVRALNNQVTRKRTRCGGQITLLVSQEGKLRVRSSSGPSALGKGTPVRCVPAPALCGCLADAVPAALVLCFFLF